MIEFYLKNESLKTEDKIQECFHYYLGLHLSYEEYYTEYDRINKKKPKKEISEFTIPSLASNSILMTSMFMKECFLEGLKRLIEYKSEIDSKDRKSYLNEEINNYKEDFNYYPDLIEEDLPDILYSKEELRRHIIPSEVGTIKDKCDSKFFELAPHQLFLKNLLSPNTQYRGVLIFHGVGVGKTCSGISIAENFKDVYGEKKNRIIILASSNIQIGWRKTIFDPRKGDNQCTGETYYDGEEDEDKNMDINDSKTKKKIKKYYELHGYAAFANSVKKLLTNKTRHITDDKEKFITEINIIKETFSNRLLIVDEVHNIRSEESQKITRDTIFYIEKVIRYADNLRLILLTANPMYNMSSEIVWILNMLLLNDGRKTILDKEIFNKDGNLVNEELLRDKCKGYISYLRGENPVSFPIRLYSNHDKDRIISSPGISTDIFGKDIIAGKELSFLELYSSDLQGKQLEIYSKEVEKFKGKIKLQIDNESLLLQLSNIVYPNESDDVKDCYGETGLMACFDRKDKQSSVEYSYKTEIRDKYGEFFKKELLSSFSSKIQTILEIIERSDGIVFIYTNWVKSGIIPLVLALEQNGYLKSDGKKILKTTSRIQPISYEGKKISDYSDKKDFKQAKYMVITGSQENLTHKLEEELRIVTSDDNKDGSRIKVIIGSSVASEGLDFKNIRSIHVLEPWHNINKIEQVIGRGIRNCSHKDLLPKERNVTIYLHTSVVPDMETIDLYLYRYSEYKAKQIGKVEMILKESALDKYFFRDANYISSKDVNKFKIEPAYRYDDGKTKLTMYQPNDKKYSRTCSFTADCNYMKNDKPKNIKINDDTFRIRYSQGLIDVYKKRIHNLFIDSVSYELNELIESLSEYKEVYEDFLFHTLREMEIEKYVLHNKFGDKGYLTITDGLYNFQPDFNNDKLLSPYYRLNRGNKTDQNYIIELKKKRESDLILERQTFGEDDILSVYERLLHYKFDDGGKFVLDLLEVDNDNYIKYSYVFDTLSFTDKLTIGYSVLLYIKEDELYEDKSILNIIVQILQPLFIYYDSKYYYKDKYDNRNKDELVGFFLYHNINKRPVFYKYENRTIQIVNKVDEIDIIQIIKQNKNHKSLMMNKTWGFTIYSERYKYKNNGIVLKIIKSTDKLRKNYTFPPGPGVVVVSQSSGAWMGDSTANFIKGTEEKDQSPVKEYYDRLDKVKADHLISTCVKKDQVFFIELCFRMKKIVIQSDLIFMKYF